MSADVMMEIEVANPLRMLSAYLITTATTKPPRACRKRILCLKECCTQYGQQTQQKNAAANKRETNDKVRMKRSIIFKPVRQQLCR